MSNNKVIYTCDVSDEGSDMDVSDNDDFLQAAPQPTIPVTQKASKQPPTRPHQGMVTSLHNYMQRDSWGKDAVSPKTEQKLKTKPVPPNENSYASAVVGRKRTYDPDESDSDDSYHTAPSSSPQVIVVDDFEPGQIAAEPSTEDTNKEILARIDELEKILENNAKKEEFIMKRLEEIRIAKEELKIRRLQREVRRSILEKRKTSTSAAAAAKKEIKIPVPPALEKTKEQQPATEEEQQPALPLPLSKHRKKVLREEAAKKRKSKKRLRSVSFEDVEVDDVVVENHPPVKEDEEMHEEAEISNNNNDDDDEEEDNEDNEDDDEDDDDDDDDDGEAPSKEASEYDRFLKRGLKLEQFENYLSPQDKALIKSDEPRYFPHPKNKSNQISKKDRKSIISFLSDRMYSLKDMGLILRNFEQASRRVERLSYRQEHFLSYLTKDLMRCIEAYVRLEEPFFSLAVKDTTNTPRARHNLDSSFYGDLSTLDLNGGEYLDKYELYKCVRHFEALVGRCSLKKARMYLLPSGGAPKDIVKRTCDPYDDTPSGSLLRSDPSAFRRAAEMSRDSKKAKQRSYIEFRKKKLGMPNGKRQGKKFGRLNDGLTAQERTARNKAIREEFDEYYAAKEAEFASKLVGRNKDKTDDSQTELKDTKPSKKQKTTHKPTPGPSHKAAPGPSHTSTFPSAIAESSAHARPLMKFGNPHAGDNQTSLNMTPIEIVDEERPQPFASHQTATPLQQNIPASPQAPSSAANNHSHYVPYQSALSSLGFAGGSSSSSTQQSIVHKSSTLCSAESSGGVCNDKRCRFTHFKDFSI